MILIVLALGEYAAHRVEICRDRHDRQSCKICASCVFFSGKQRDFSHNLHRTLNLHTPSVILH